MGGFLVAGRGSLLTAAAGLCVGAGLLGGCGSTGAYGEYAVIDGERAPVPAIPMGDAGTVKRVLDEAETDSRVMAILTELCGTHGSRLTGSTACEEANIWAMEKFASWGLADARMDQWGEVDARFDRLESTGELVERPMRRPRDEGEEAGEPEWESARGLEFTTLSWTRGTEGPVVGRVVRMPEDAGAFEEDPSVYEGAWVLLPAQYASRRGVRGVGYGMRARHDTRHEIRTGVYDPMQDAEPEAWEGTVTHDDREVGLTFRPERDERGEIVGGEIEILGFHTGPVTGATSDGETLTMIWENPFDRSEISLAIDGESMEGTAGEARPMTLTRTVGPDERSLTREADAVLARVLEAGPAGFISASPDERVWTTRPNGWRELEIEDVPQDIEVLVRRSDYDHMNSRIADGQEVWARFDLPHRLIDGPIPVYNTIAEIRGSTKPEEVVIVSAHLDSWDGPMSVGTVDNGTGSAVVMEAARLLMEAGARPDRTIRFVLWTGEEQGLLGSRAYVEELDGPERARVSAVFVDDGGTNYEGGLPAADNMVDYLAAATAAVNGRFYSEEDGEWMDVNIRPTGETIRTHGGSDHAPFNAVGIPGFFWDEVGRADYRYGWHTQNDQLDLAIPEYLVQSSACMAITAYNLACAPELLPREPEETGEDEG